MRTGISTGISVFIGILLFACVMMQQGWAGSADIQLNDGRTAHCPDHLVTTPVAVSCFTDTNGGKNIFTVPKSKIREIFIGSPTAKSLSNYYPVASNHVVGMFRRQ